MPFDATAANEKIAQRVKDALRQEMLGDKALAPFTNGTFHGLARAAGIVGAEALAHIDRLSRRVDELESKLLEAEQAGGIKYMGVWRPDTFYSRGSFVTYAGGMWFANLDGTEKPGTGPHWTLAIKSGARS